MLREFHRFALLALLSAIVSAEEDVTLAKIERDLLSKDVMTQAGACISIVKLKNPPATLIPKIAESWSASDAKQEAPIRVHKAGEAAIVWFMAMTAAGKSHTPELLKLLPSRAHRGLAIFALARLKPLDALPAILPLVKSNDPETKLLYLEVLKEIADESDPYPKIQVEARTDAERAKLREALEPFVPVVIDALNGSNKELQLGAVAALCHLHASSPAVAERLAELAGLHEYYRWHSIPAALGSMGNAAAPAVPILLNLMKHSNSRIRKNAVDCFAHSSQFLAQAALEQMLVALKSDADEDVRWYAAEGLEESGVETPDVVRALATALSDPGVDRKVRSTAAIALARMKRPPLEAMAELIETCETVDPREKERYTSQIEARRWAVKALGNIGVAATNAVPALAALLEDESVYVRYHAAEALAKMKGRARQALPNLLIAAKRAGAEDFELREIARAIKAIQDSDGPARK